MRTAILLITISLLACKGQTEKVLTSSATNPLVGTWQLITGTVIEKGDTAVTDYTNKISFLKIINNTHFAFLKHDLHRGKDSSAVFVSGGGRYSLNDSLYREQLEYCSAREWEGNVFNFTIAINNDTLIQRGVEKVNDLGIERMNIERYVRVKE